MYQLEKHYAALEQLKRTLNPDSFTNIPCAMCGEHPAKWMDVCKRCYFSADYAEFRTHKRKPKHWPPPSIIVAHTALRRKLIKLDSTGRQVCRHCGNKAGSLVTFREDCPVCNTCFQIPGIVREIKQQLGVL